MGRRSSPENFLEKLGMKHPLIVAPMAGGPSSPELVVAACNAGALGSIGAAYSTGKDTEDFVRTVRLGTKAAIAINLFAPYHDPSTISQTQLSQAIRATEPFRHKLGLEPPAMNPPFEENFDEQFESVLKMKPEVFSFVFGLLKPEYMRAAHKEGIFLLGTATTLTEALELEESGVDAVVLQGVEAGGHRGMFDPQAADPDISILELLAQCRMRVNIPLVAAGGFMTSQDIRNALAKGAQAVQLGTAFLTCKEAGTSEPYRKALLATSRRETKTTRAFSGRLARGLKNAFMLEMDKNPEATLPFQAQNKFTRDIRSASAKAGSSECLSLWAGTGEGPLWTGSAMGLIQQLFPVGE